MAKLKWFGLVLALVAIMSPSARAKGLPKVAILTGATLVPFPTKSDKEWVEKWNEEFTNRGFDVVPFTKDNMVTLADGSWDYAGAAQILIVQKDIALGSQAVTFVPGMPVSQATAMITVDVLIPSIDQSAPVVTIAAWGRPDSRNVARSAIKNVSNEVRKWYDDNEEALAKAMGR